MFRSYDHPQGAYFVPCYSYSLKHSVRVLNCNFTKEQSVLPEDDPMIETYFFSLLKLQFKTH